MTNRLTGKPGVEPREIVLKEYPNTTYWLEENIAHEGNLILTSERLVFLKRVGLLEKRMAELEKATREAKTPGELLQYTLSLHKKNFQVLLSQVTYARTGIYSKWPIRICLRVGYRSLNKKQKEHVFLFTSPFIKRLVMSIPLAPSWTRAINQAVKDGGKVPSSYQPD